MHEKTKALLEAVKEWRTTSAVLEVVGHWLDAGCPDLDAPDPDRLAELTERVDAINNWVKILNEQHALHGGELSELRTSTASAIMRLTDRIKALEPEPAPPPEPARFVPTEPGWYWVEQPDGRRYPAWWEPGFGRNAMHWLGPVAPYAPPTRTEEEARREPRRGDRWRHPFLRITYTALSPAIGDQWLVRCGDGSCGRYRPGQSTADLPDVYLGNFAHELEAP